jgi:hypothetical protein
MQLYVRRHGRMDSILRLFCQRTINPPLNFSSTNRNSLSWAAFAGQMI